MISLVHRTSLTNWHVQVHAYRFITISMQTHSLFHLSLYPLSKWHKYLYWQLERTPYMASIFTEYQDKILVYLWGKDQTLNTELIFYPPLLEWLFYLHHSYLLLFTPHNIRNFANIKPIPRGSIQNKGFSWNTFAIKY